MAKKIGVLTAGSDCPGLNAAIRAFGKAALSNYGISLVGFRDGFEGLLSNDWFQIGSRFCQTCLQLGEQFWAPAGLFPIKFRRGGAIVDKNRGRC